MTLDIPSFALGVTVAATVAWAWMMGRDSAIRHCRRIYRHGRALDYVFFEDAERDPTIETPKPQQHANFTPIATRLP